MKAVRTVVSVAAIVLAIGASARTFEVAAWRGETVAARVPDFAELGGEPPAGVSVRYGVMKSVKYAPKAGSLQRLEVYDRVVWGGEGDGPRVVEVSVSPDAKPGTYLCGMMNIRIVDRVLPPPREWKYYLDLWQHPWAVSRIAGVKPFSKEHYAAMKPVWELLATAGQKTITVPIVDLPWDHQCYDAYHSMIEDPDFKLFDEYVQFCLDCGLGPDISCYSLCPWTLGKTIDEDALENFWGEKFDRFVSHVRAKGWFANTLMALDERAPEDVAKVAAFVQRHAPGMRIAMAGNRRPSEFKGIKIDVYSQVMKEKYLNKKFLDEVKERAKEGLVTTHYVCCSPAKPNTFMDSSDAEPFWCGAMPAFLGLDGFLRWAWNSWPQDPCSDATYGNWRSGDTFLCYPGGEPSWRFLDLRNGIVASEKVWILKKAGALDEEEFGDAAAGYRDLFSANDGRCWYWMVREKTLGLVNK